MVKGEFRVVAGVPDIVTGDTKLSPEGKPLIARINAADVSASVKVLAGIVKLKFCPTVADWGGIAFAATGAVLAPEVVHEAGAV
jgi:hypothetical protein